MSTIAQNKPMFQWIRGEKAGTIVKSTGETVNDGNMEFLIFEDGSQCNTSLIGEWIVPIDSPADALMLPEPQPTMIRDMGGQVQRVNGVAEPAKVPTPQPAANPVHDLLKMSKKKSMKMQLSITVDMPSEDLIKVINDSYPNGTQHIGDYLVSSIDDAAIKTQIENILRAKVEEVTKKKRATKNENTI